MTSRLWLLLATLLATPALATPAERFAACGGFLEGAAFDPAGLLWVVDLNGGRILSVDANGRCTERGNTGGRPNGARFGPDGRLYVADNARGLLAVDTRTMKIEVIADRYRGEPIRSANDIAFDGAGGLYFTDPAGSDALDRKGRLFYLASGSRTPELVSDRLAFPNGVVVTSDGEAVLVGQFADKSILSLPSRRPSKAFRIAYVLLRTEGGTGPDGMTRSPDGTLYWAEFGAGRVGRADALGHILPSLPLGPGAGPMATNVAVRNGFLYVTEAFKGEIWRIRLS